MKKSMEKHKIANKVRKKAVLTASDVVETFGRLFCCKTNQLDH